MTTDSSSEGSQGKFDQASSGETSAEQYRQFRGIYENPDSISQVPEVTGEPFNPETIKTLSSFMDRINTSDHKLTREAVKGRVRSNLVTSRLSPWAIGYILSNFDMYYDLGRGPIDQPDDVNNQVYWTPLFDLANQDPENSGPFGNKALDYERYWYHRALVEELDTERSLAENPDREDIRELERELKGQRMPQAEFLAKWRQDFIKRNSQEP